MRRHLWGSLAIVLTLGGCGALPSPEDRAADSAQEKAGRVLKALYGHGRVWTAQDMGHRASELDDVDVMKVSGETTHDGGVRVVIRVEGSAGGDSWGSPEVITVRRCYELTFNSETDWEDTPDQVTCPKGTPLKFAPWPKTPELPSQARLRKALPRVPKGGTVNETKVRQAVTDLRLDPAIRAEYLTLGNVVGLSLTVKPYLDTALDCVLARITPGKTDVFTPAARIQRMPGEGGCSPGNAISPMPPPH
ncbi:translation initiation factor IF-2 [Thermomonospora umbrina]|uniref:Uncharacterized protein n=1 Tax=Thermomonospora umbrina TaxID=111806 RepID=A0A3D9SVC1_9ACTN|nr:translation initiation factor IF-2 [Thermomonospora umbrina]REE97993.1 hypothetical protein DFJ69_3473 [Thermomonospora umbrina]